MIARELLDFNIADSAQLIPGNLYFKDSKGVYIWCSKGQLDTFGFTELAQIVGKTDFDLCDKMTASKIRAADLRVMESGKPEIFVEEGVYGNLKVTLSYKAPLRNKKGEVIGLVGNSVDMAAQKELQMKLQQDNRSKTIALENIIQNTPAHIYWKDKNGAILGCNDKQARVFGLKSGQEFIGKTVFDFIDKESAQKIHDNDIHIIQSGNTEIVEESAILNGKKCTYISHKSPLKDQITGEVFGVVGVSIDITKQKELERAYIEKALELTRALEVKQDFLNNMSHEVRTPLQGIVGMAEALEGSWEQISDDVKRNCIKSFLEARDRLMNLLSNLLDLSKLTKGRAYFEFKYWDIKLLIIEVITEFQYITQPIDLRIAADVDTHICCDDWRFKQVIRNVIANAVKHGGKDKPITISLTTCHTKKDKFLKIAIQDEGVGIPENELEAIFDPFYESKRTKRMSGGTGIGLALCKDIVIAHKGTMWVENNKKAGSTFYITLPYEKQGQQVYTFRLTRQS